jgi:ribosome-associated translation inhibitor RaiA
MKLLFLTPIFCMGLFTELDFLLTDYTSEGVSKEYKVEFSSAKDRKVMLTMDNSDVKITGYDGNEVVIEASRIDEPPKRADGLKPLYNTAVDNSGLGLSVTKENNTIKILKAAKYADVKYTIKVPKQVSIKFEEVNPHSNDISIEGIEGAVEVNSHSSDVRLTDIDGSVVAKSIGGDVTVVFSNLSQQKPSNISVIGSIVDVSLPADTKVNLRMKSMSGEIYTDFDLAIDNDKQGLRKVGGGNLIEGKANGGGVAMSIESIGSDIFIRKKK